MFGPGIPELLHRRQTRWTAMVSPAVAAGGGVPVPTMVEVVSRGRRYAHAFPAPPGMTCPSCQYPTGVTWRIPGTYWSLRLKGPDCIHPGIDTMYDFRLSAKNIKIILQWKELNHYLHYLYVYCTIYIYEYIYLLKALCLLFCIMTITFCRYLVVWL